MLLKDVDIIANTVMANNADHHKDESDLSAHPCLSKKYGVTGYTWYRQNKLTIFAH